MHTQLVMCKHRLGMICAAGADHRAATKLLQLSHDRYQGGGGTGTGLAKEADVGLAFARCAQCVCVCVCTCV